MDPDLHLNLDLALAAQRLVDAPEFVLDDVHAFMHTYIVKPALTNELGTPAYVAARAVLAHALAVAYRPATIIALTRLFQTCVDTHATFLGTSSSSPSPLHDLWRRHDDFVKYLVGVFACVNVDAALYPLGVRSFFRNVRVPLRAAPPGPCGDLEWAAAAFAFVDAATAAPQEASPRPPCPPYEASSRVLQFAEYAVRDDGTRAAYNRFAANLARQHVDALVADVDAALRRRDRRVSAVVYALVQHLADKTEFCVAYTRACGVRLLGNATTVAAERAALLTLSQHGINLPDCEAALTDFAAAPSYIVGRSFVTVVSDSVWSGAPWTYPGFEPPREFVTTMDACAAAYAASHDRRHLRWAWGYGSAVLVVRPSGTGLSTSSSTATIQLYCTTLQAAVLLAFNRSSAGTMTLRALQDATNLDVLTLKVVLGSLGTADARIVSRESDVCTVLPLQLWQQRKVRVPVPKLPTQARDPGLGVVVDALIVRTMKARRRMCHHDLVREVAVGVTAAFARARIDRAVTNKYLRRISGPTGPDADGSNGPDADGSIDADVGRVVYEYVPD